jgi:hypothetical protein
MKVIFHFFRFKSVSILIIIRCIFYKFIRKINETILVRSRKLIKITILISSLIWHGIRYLCNFLHVKIIIIWIIILISKICTFSSSSELKICLIILIFIFIIIILLIIGSITIIDILISIMILINVLYDSLFFLSFFFWVLD